MAQRVADRLGEGRFGRDVRDLTVEPALHGADQRPALGLADAGSVIGQATVDARLDVVELGDPAQRLGRDRRAGGMVEVKELAPDMGPAEGELDHWPLAAD
jgi:hypothetical protein